MFYYQRHTFVFSWLDLAKRFHLHLSFHPVPSFVDIQSQFPFQLAGRRFFVFVKLGGLYI